MEPIVPLQTSNVMLAPKWKHRVTLITLAVVAVILYAGFNVWLYKGMIINENSSFPATATGSMRKNEQRTGSQLLTPVPTPTPTPRPTGPGQYACDPVGQCKIYSDDVRVEKCPVTYADLHCLDQCGDTTKRCKP